MTSRALAVPFSDVSPAASQDHAKPDSYMLAIAPKQPCLSVGPSLAPHLPPRSFIPGFAICGCYPGHDGPIHFTVPQIFTCARN